MTEAWSNLAYHRGDAFARFPVPQTSFEDFDISSNVAMADSSVAVGRAYERMTERIEAEAGMHFCEHSGPDCAALASGIYDVESGAVHITCRKGMLNKRQAVGRSVIATTLVDIRKRRSLYSGVKQLDRQCAEHMQAVGQQMVSIWVEELSIEQVATD